MSWPKATLELLKRYNGLCDGLQAQFSHREEVIKVLGLGAVCQEHALLLGPPGTAKTELLTRFSAQLDAPRFHYLLTRFTEPAELFGPMDLPAFQDGRYHVRTEGMLPRAAIAFLDEVFQGGSAILNTLLTLVNERLFLNGAERQAVPLITLVGASNELPEDSALRAFADRFVLRVQVDPVPDGALGDLLDHGWALEMERFESQRRAAKGGPVPRVLPVLSEEQLRRLHAHLHEVKLDGVRPIYEETVREMRAAALEISDRRIIKGLKLVAGSALLEGREEATPADLWPLLHMWTRQSDAAEVRRLVEPKILDAGGSVQSRERDAEQIQDELELIYSREERLRGETAIGAHLQALNRLRREAIQGHPTNTALRERIEAAIQRVIAALEGADV